MTSPNTQDMMIIAIVALTIIAAFFAGTTHGYRKINERAEEIISKQGELIKMLEWENNKQREAISVQGEVIESHREKGKVQDELIDSLRSELKKSKR